MQAIVTVDFGGADFGYFSQLNLMSASSWIFVKEKWALLYQEKNRININGKHDLYVHVYW